MEKEFVLLDRFFAKKGSWVYDQTLNKVSGIILMIVVLTMYAFPFLPKELVSIDRMMLLWMLVLEIWGMSILIKPYLAFNYEKRQYLLKDILKTLPVSKKALFTYRMRKLFSIVWKFALCAICIQGLCTYLFAPDFLVWNVLICAGLSFVLPMVCLGLILIFY